MPTLYQAIVVALIATFIILFLGKTGLRIRLRDYYDKIGISILADMLDCDFCLSFWTCVIVAMFLWTFGYKPDFLVLLCAPPITRYLL
jgi:hypothetical protein